MRRSHLSSAAFAVAIVGTTALATPAAAQIAWDAPHLTGPHSPTGLGVYWVRPEVLPGDDDAVLVTWGLPGTGGAVGLRGGVGKGVVGESAVFGGVELRAPIARHDDVQPLDIEWSAGAGVGVGEYVLLSVPFAVSAGRSWSSGSVWFAPYVSAGATVDYRLGDSDLVPEKEFEVQATAGLGADIAFDEARRVVLRVATSLGDRQAIALGLVVGGAR